MDAPPTGVEAFNLEHFEHDQFPHEMKREAHATVGAIVISHFRRGAGNAQHDRLIRITARRDYDGPNVSTD